MATALAHFGIGDLDAGASVATGDPETDANARAAEAKLARGETLSPKEGGYLATGAVYAAGAYLPEVAASAPYFAALVAAEVALVEGADWLFQKLGWHAGAGPGWCSTAPDNDPRRRAHTMPAPTNGFEDFAFPLLNRLLAIFGPCGATPIPNWGKVVRALADTYSRTHAGPSKRYTAPIERTGGHGFVYYEDAPSGGFPLAAALEVTGAIDVNIGPPIAQRGSSVRGGALSVLEINQPRYVPPTSRLGLKELAARDAMTGGGAPRVSSAALTTTEKVVLGGGMLTVAGLAFAFWKGWIG